MLKVAVVGGTGYTGFELVRLLSNHPQAKVEIVSSRHNRGELFTKYFQSLVNKSSIDYAQQLIFTDAKIENLQTCDVVFFATPHGVAMSMARELVAQGVKIIDLAADFRLQDLKVWEEWYAMPHTATDLMPQVAYGLSELWRKQIKRASIIANPGCYPTATLLGLAPFLHHKLVDLSQTIIIDAKSGVTGAGRVAKTNLLFSEINDSFSAYGLNGHRHLPEINQGLSSLAGAEVRCVFAPHLVPMSRGIEASIYINLKSALDIDVQDIMQKFYQEESFVEIMPSGTMPSTNSVRGSNMCRIGWGKCPTTGTIIITSVIDNLVKGAAGQAIQNMNLLYGLDETMGLGTACT